jgi:hypothetical protein
MSYENIGQVVPGLTASADLSTKQFYLCNIGSTGVAVNVTAGGQVDGVLLDKPAAAGRACALQVDGVCKVQAGGTITAGDLLASDNAGKAVTAATTDKVFGRALGAGASGSLVTVLLKPGAGHNALS